MKVAVISDIHANLPALEAVLDDVERWRPDVVVVNGDVINRGPQPRECWTLVWDRAQREGWHLTIGNHEQYVLEHADGRIPRGSPQFYLYYLAYWTYLHVKDVIEDIRALPFDVQFRLEDGHSLYITHASPRHVRDGLYPDMPNDALLERMPTHVKAMCVAHTHRAFVRWLEGRVVVNAGAVGLPFDGDPRASYARCVCHRGRWDASIVRVPYDRAAAERAFESTGFLDEVGPIAHLVLVEFREARSQLYQWTVRYQEAVLQGELSLEEAVRRFLAEEGITYPLRVRT